MRILPVFVVFALLGANQICAEITFDASVTNNVIFGDGNANGFFVVDQNSGSGVELGLRAKLRHNADGDPENTFNSDGEGTYSFAAGVAPTQAFPTGVWSFEWSINSDYQNGTNVLNSLTYMLSMTSTTGAFITAFDPINGVNPHPAVGVVFWDHAIGDGTTLNGEGAVAVDEANYATLIGSNTLAQNSWKPHWFSPGYDPNDQGEYFFTLSAFNGTTLVGQTSMTVSVVPEPSTIAMLAIGLCPLAIRRRKKLDS